MLLALFLRGKAPRNIPLPISFAPALLECRTAPAVMRVKTSLSIPARLRTLSQWLYLDHAVESGRSSMEIRGTGSVSCLGWVLSSKQRLNKMLFQSKK